MKDAGFDSVRIPVAWTSTMDWRNGDFKINDDFMDRVKTLVDWALDAGLIVMINDHWDYQWWGLFGQDKTLAYKIFDAIWDDVGTNFKDYSYKLVFDFTTDAGILNYLNHKEFQVEDVWFKDAFIKGEL